MKNKSIVITIFLLILLLAALLISGQLEIDSCLDQGGRWLEASRTCEGNNPYQ